MDQQTGRNNNIIGDYDDIYDNAPGASFNLMNPMSRLMFEELSDGGMNNPVDQPTNNLVDDMMADDNPMGFPEPL